MDPLVHKDVRFNIFSGMLKALPDPGDGIPRLRTTASSTIKDLSGDEMTLTALQKMASTAERGMTIFLNHKYMVPEDVLGTVEKAEISPRGDFYDLDFDIRVNQSNPRAVSTHKAIVDDGVQLGCSIGAVIPQGGATKTDDGLQIDDVKLLEASIVGIPANPRSFVHYATKALEQAALEEAEEPEIEVSGPPIQIKATPNTTIGITQATNNTNGGAQIQFTEELEMPADGIEKEAVNVPLGEEAEIDTEKEAAPPAEGDQGDSDAGDEPAEAPATQEAPQSDPESDGADTESDGDEQAEAQKAIGLEAVSGLLKSTTHELVDTRKALTLETKRADEAEARVSELEEDLLLAKQIIERVASLPIGRKTSYRAGVSEFRTKLAGLYSDDVMNLLERTPDGT